MSSEMLDHLRHPDMVLLQRVQAVRPGGEIVLPSGADGEHVLRIAGRLAVEGHANAAAGALACVLWVFHDADGLVGRWRAYNPDRGTWDVVTEEEVRMRLSGGFFLTGAAVKWLVEHGELPVEALAVARDCEALAVAD